MSLGLTTLGGEWLKKRIAWKGGRVVEGTALEKRHTRKGIESSNLSLSATNEVSVSKGKMRSLCPFRVNPLISAKIENLISPHRTSECAALQKHKSIVL